MDDNFWTLLKDPVVWEGIERIVIELGAIFCLWAGYIFYRVGIKERAAKGSLGSYTSNFWTSGTGAGLCCIILGAIILLAGLITKGEVKHTAPGDVTAAGVQREQIDALGSSIAKLDARIDNLHKTMEKLTPDNATRNRSEHAHLKKELEELTTRIDREDSARASKKGESRRSRKKWSEDRDDNGSSY